MKEGLKDLAVAAVVVGGMIVLGRAVVRMFSTM